MIGDRDRTVVQFLAVEHRSVGTDSGAVECHVHGDWLHVHFPKSIKVRMKQSDGSFKNERVFCANTKFWTEGDIEWLKAGNNPQFNPQGYLMLPEGNRFSRQAKRKAGRSGTFDPVLL